MLRRARILHKCFHRVESRVSRLEFFARHLLTLPLGTFRLGRNAATAAHPRILASLVDGCRNKKKYKPSDRRWCIPSAPPTLLDVLAGSNACDRARDGATDRRPLPPRCLPCPNPPPSLACQLRPAEHNYEAQGSRVDAESDSVGGVGLGRDFHPSKHPLEQGGGYRRRHDRGVRRDRRPWSPVFALAHA